MLRWALNCPNEEAIWATLSPSRVPVRRRRREPSKARPLGRVSGGKVRVKRVWMPGADEDGAEASREDRPPRRRRVIVSEVWLPTATRACVEDSPGEEVPRNRTAKRSGMAMWGRAPVSIWTGWEKGLSRPGGRGAGRAGAWMTWREPRQDGGSTRAGPGLEGGKGLPLGVLGRLRLWENGGGAPPARGSIRLRSVSLVAAKLCGPAGRTARTRFRSGVSTYVKAETSIPGMSRTELVGQS
jgi:hypothetical protein